MEFGTAGARVREKADLCRDPQNRLLDKHLCVAPNVVRATLVQTSSRLPAAPRLTSWELPTELTPGSSATSSGTCACPRFHGSAACPGACPSGMLRVHSRLLYVHGCAGLRGVGRRHRHLHRQRHPRRELLPGAARDGDAQLDDLGLPADALARGARRPRYVDRLAACLGVPQGLELGALGRRLRGRCWDPMGGRIRESLGGGQGPPRLAQSEEAKEHLPHALGSIARVITPRTAASSPRLRPSRSAMPMLNQPECIEGRFVATTFGGGRDIALLRLVDAFVTLRSACTAGATTR